VRLLRALRDGTGLLFLFAARPMCFGVLDNALLSHGLNKIFQFPRALTKQAGLIRRNAQISWNMVVAGILRRPMSNPKRPDELTSVVNQRNPMGTGSNHRGFKLLRDALGKLFRDDPRHSGPPPDEVAQHGKLASRPRTKFRWGQGIEMVEDCNEDVL
jgi:hypothetical protein